MKKTLIWFFVLSFIVLTSIQANPSYHEGFASSPAEAEYPNLRNGLIFAMDFTLGNTGSTIHDFSGRKQHGSLTTAVWNTSKYGPVITWNKDGGISIPDSDLLDGMKQISIAAWIRLTDLSNPTIEDNVVERWASGATAYLLRWDAQTNRWEWYVDTGGTASCLATIASMPGVSNPEDAKWHFLVATYDGATMKVYQDGVQSTVTTSDTGAIAAVTTATLIGDDDGNADEWKGDIASVAMWRRALTHSEIKQMYADSYALTREREDIYRAPDASSPPPASTRKFIMISGDYSYHRNDSPAQFLADVQDLIPSTHPRIYVLQSELAGLRTELGTNTLYTDLKSWADSNLVNVPGSLTISSKDAVSSYALVYLIEDDTTYSDAVKLLLDDFKDETFSSNGVNMANCAMSMALGYDWIHDQLSEAEKTTYVDAMLTFVDSWLFPDQPNWYPSSTMRAEEAWFPKNYVFTNATNYVGMKNLHVGVAIFRDGINDLRGDEIVRDYGHFLEKHVVPAYNLVHGTNGGWQEDYGHTSLALAINQHLHMWDVATGRDITSEYTGGALWGEWMTYCTRPDGGAQIQANSATVVETDLANGTTQKGIHALIANKYQDTTMNLFVDGTFGIASRPLGLLWYDDTLGTATLASKPLVKHFDGTGCVIMRTGWNFGSIGNPSSDLYARFQGGNWYQAHQHMDQGGLYIYKDGPLLCDGGKKGTEGRPNTIFHNTLYLDNENQIFGGSGGYVGKEGWKNYGPGTASDLATITKLTSTSDYDYIRCDVTNAYDAAKLDTFFRHVVFLRPDTFYVFDHVVTDVGTTSQQILWNSWGEPIEDPSSDDVYIDSGLGGRLWTRFLLPSDGTHTITNFASETNYNQEKSNWRIATYPGTATTEVYFLHAFEATGTSSTEMVNITIGTETAEFVTVSNGTDTVKFYKDDSVAEITIN